jgi:hypothetical protein
MGQLRVGPSHFSGLFITRMIYKNDGINACYRDVTPTDQRIARVEISSLLSVQIDKPPAPASGTGRIEKVMGDRRAFDRTAPGPSGDIFPARASRPIALGILHERSVDEIRLTPAGRRRPSESVGGGNKTNLAGPRGDRSLSQRHEAGRHIRRLGRVDRIHRRREQFNGHGKSVCQLSIYRQFRPI